MEDVIGVYERELDPECPVVCLDELSKELRSTPAGSIAPSPGQAERQDYEYAREGTCNVFLSVEPLAGKRYVHITDRRTACDFAEELKFLVDEVYAAAQKVVLITDNLNTHSPASLYERFAPEEARRLADKLEWHYTPEHGSWLNMAEIELSVLSQQCLARRLPDKATVIREVAAWERQRNNRTCKIDWQFKNKDARIKLKRLYPAIQEASSDASKIMVTTH